MAESTDHAMNGDLCSACSDTSEESGWTFYFDEFLASQKNEAESSITTSMISDAASYAARKYTVKADASLKMRKAAGVPFAGDDPLEDTACSPEKGIEGEKCAELKKRGVCLIPFSMIVDFLAK